MRTAIAFPTREYITRSRAWLGLLILLPFALSVLLSRAPLPEGTPAEFWFDAAGWMLFAGGAAFRWWATLYIGGRKTKQLACEGPYSICRNPLYFGTFLMCLSVAVVMQSFTFAGGLAIASMFYLSVTVSNEEHHLRRTFGHEYTEYCRRVPRFWPRPSLFQSRETIEVSVHGLMAEAGRAVRWVWIPVLCEFVAHLRAEPWWPHPFHMP